MVIAFSNNQVIITKNPTQAVIYTDPVPLEGNDRATAHLLVESMFNPAAGLTYVGQVSNDGTNWVDTSLTDAAAAVTPTPQALTKTINGAFLRFKYTFDATAPAGTIGGCCFDLHVNLDHA